MDYTGYPDFGKFLELKIGNSRAIYGPFEWDSGT